RLPRLATHHVGKHPRFFRPVRNCLRQAESFDQGPFKVSVRAHLPLHPEKVSVAINDSLQFASNAWSKRSSERVLNGVSGAFIVVLSSWNPSAVTFQHFQAQEMLLFWASRELWRIGGGSALLVPAERREQGNK